MFSFNAYSLKSKVFEWKESLNASHYHIIFMILGLFNRASVVFLRDYDKIYFLDRARKIYERFPKIPMALNLAEGDDDDIKQLSEAMGEAKTRVEGCSSFLKAAIK